MFLFTYGRSASIEIHVRSLCFFSSSRVSIGQTPGFWLGYYTYSEYFSILKLSILLIIKKKNFFAASLIYLNYSKYFCGSY